VLSVLANCTKDLLVEPVKALSVSVAAEALAEHMIPRAQSL